MTTTSLTPYYWPVTLTGEPVRPPRRPKRPHRPDAYLEQILGAYRPSYNTPLGEMTAGLLKFYRLDNGEQGAIYQLKYYSPFTHQMYVNNILFCVQFTDSKPKELRQHFVERQHRR